MVVDTLLNVFLAIAVDNLANAQELTAAEEADEKANELEEEESEDMEEVGYCTIRLHHSLFILLIGIPSFLHLKNETSCLLVLAFGVAV